ncbi:MAG: heat-inducible transcriptional repressor HrcA [Acidimicrobiales bacterium]
MTARPAAGPLGIIGAQPAGAFARLPNNCLIIMLDDRKAAILRAIVSGYIENAQPVGSNYLARTTGLGVSSATVRNDMAVLEQEGYLHQPHTSAGRVPTEKGYRFFVDSLNEPDLTSFESQRVRDFFAQAHAELEQMLARTSRLLSDLTHYSAVVIGPQHEVGSLRSVQLVSLGPRLALVVAVLSNGVIEKQALELAEGVGEAELAEASALLSKALHGCPLRACADVALAASGQELVDATAAAAVAALGAHARTSEELYIGGAARMAESFDAVDTVRRVLSLLEEQYVVVTLLRDVLNRGLSVAIGSETGVEPLAECSLVVAPYFVDGEPAGSVGVLGPTRMNYPQALAAVAVVSQRLSKRLTEG